MSDGTGDDAFRALFEPHRRSITLYCYRMLGSLADAEEVVQESLLRAWQRRDEVRHAPALRAWLYQIATHACLDQLRKTRRRTLPHWITTARNAGLTLGPASDEELWVEPAPDTLLEPEDAAGERPDHRVSLRESVGLAFVTALQQLSPKQRAALLLVDVLGYRPEETATLLETSVVSVNSLLQRARSSVATRRQERAELSSADSEQLRRFVLAWESGDLDAFSALLASDAILSMPPQPEWFQGRESLHRFFAAVWTKVPGARRLLPVQANGGPAFALYRRTPPGNAGYRAVAIVVVTMRDRQVAELTRFANPDLFSHFGLPLELPQVL